MRSLPIAILGLAIATAAGADVIKLRDKTFVKVNVKRDHVVTAGIMLGRFADPSAGDLFMTRAVAIKAQELGFPRFAILKDRCGTVNMNGSSLYSQCSLTAQLLGPNDEVTAAHQQEPRFVIVTEALALPLPASG